MENVGAPGNQQVDILARVRKFNAVLDQLMQIYSEDILSELEFFRHVTRAVCLEMEVPRFSLWSLDDDESAIRCIDLFEAESDNHSSGFVLNEASFPEYFKAVLRDRVVDAVDAGSDPRTSEFLDVYLKPVGIRSMLDAQIRSAAGPRGVVCAETLGVQRDWTPDEIAFVISVAEMVGFFMDREDRRLVHATLERVNNQLEDAVRTAKEATERYDLALKGASDGLFDIDYLTGRVFFSPRWFQMLGYKANGLPNEIETFASLLHPDDVEHVVILPEQIYDLAGDVVEREFRMRHKNGSWVTILSRAYIVRRAGKLARVVGTHVDISELRQQQAELERAATTDPLTGIRNRRGLAGFIAKQAVSRKVGSRLAIFHLDLDSFKSINDMNGHEAGDHVLKEIASRLTAHRAAFPVIARVGGDEFLLAQTSHGDDASVLEIAQQVVEDVSLPIQYFGLSLRIGASIGIAFAEDTREETIEQAAANADIALYAAKSMGRNHCLIFESGMRAAAMRAIEVSSDIHYGLERDEFQPLFQPQVDASTGKIVGFEALARWYHPSRGLLSASEFVSYAENAHLLEAIDDTIFEHACEAIPILAAFGVGMATVSVNVSTARLGDARLVEKLIRATDRVCVARDRIRIEILESTLLNERCGNILRNIFELSKAGFEMELDDFGTGHTAIASLRNYPISRIKIDRSLITDIQQDRTLQALSGTIVDLGRKLGIDVLAEGVETDEELRYLTSIGCSQVQGYLIAEPMPLETLRTWIEDWTGQVNSRSEYERYRDVVGNRMALRR
ncbi:EAL domain-containing protein [Tropicimonas sp. TH_r6]|uniref:putative bifunctional diguanylate cyclase/phosphodiesterase n=1 Tax=Tropicimonas sp. TH_r6 TaxID=3082085 RepID=UPI002953D694|nr:EAL domain-containing protein [Tropicimonas sp. TH_r6]MDV7145210.1 EAL domain-containing protein [Tropicimonas sp. TH_r6]